MTVSETGAAGPMPAVGAHGLRGVPDTLRPLAALERSR